MPDTIELRADGTVLLDGEPTKLLAMFDWSHEDQELTSASFDIDPYRRRRIVFGGENGWSVSAIWGTMTYSSNALDYRVRHQTFREEVTHVEIALLDSEHVVGDVFSYKTVDELLAFVDAVINWPSSADGETLAKAWWAEREEI